MKHLQLFEEFFSGTTPMPPGFTEIHTQLEPKGYTMDLEGKETEGQPHIYRGITPDTRASIIFTPKGWKGMTPKDKYTLVVTIDGKELTNKEYPMNSPQEAATTVEAIMKSLKPMLYSIECRTPKG